MNRYDLLRLVRELGRIVETAHSKTVEEVASELIACGQRKLAEAKIVDGANQSPNGTVIPSPTMETAALPKSGGEMAHSVVAAAPTDAAQA